MVATIGQEPKSGQFQIQAPVCSDTNLLPLAACHSILPVWTVIADCAVATPTAETD